MWKRFIYGTLPSKDMQTLPLPLSEMVKSSWKMRIVLKQLKNHFSDFCNIYFWVMVNFIHNFQVFLPTIYGKNYVSKDAPCSETDFCVLEFFLCNF